MPVSQQPVGPGMIHVAWAKKNFGKMRATRTARTYGGGGSMPGPKMQHINTLSSKHREVCCCISMIKPPQKHILGPKPLVLLLK